MARGHLVRAALPMLTIRKAVVKIQSAARTRLARTRLNAAKRAATLIQSMARGKAARELYKHSQRSATGIEAHGRGMMARKRYMASVAAVVMAQRRWRAAHEVRQIRQQTDKARQAALRIQRIARGRPMRREYGGLRDAAREAAAQAALEKAADLHMKNKQEEARLHSGLARTDAATQRRALLPSGPPDIFQLYAASSSELAGARRRRMPKEPPTSLSLSPGLAAVEPKAMLAQLAETQARFAADPMNKYDTYSVTHDSLLQSFLAERSYHGKPAARRERGRAALAGERYGTL